MDEIHKILQTLREEGLLYKAMQYGVKPEEIKNVIIENFNPYFENKEILKKFSIDFLVPEFINFLKIKNEKWLFIIFEKYYEILRKAKNVSEKNCYKSISYWYPNILDSDFKFWSIFNLQFDKNLLPDAEKVFDCFRNIGDIIEGLTKPYLNNLLSQIEIINNIILSFQEIEAFDLGKIVNRLILKSEFPELFVPPLLNIKINQWRNIAYHHSFKIVNDGIILCYGRGKNKKEMLVSHNDILEIARNVFNCLKVHKLAYNIFFVDNIEDIKEYLSNEGYDPRFEGILINIASAIVSQGFEIVNLEKNVIEAKLIVKDLTDLDLIKRASHSSQFLYSLWLMTKSKKLIIEYRQKDGIPKFIFKINSDVCEKVNKGEIEFPDIAAQMDIIKLKDDKKWL